MASSTYSHFHFTPTGSCPWRSCWCPEDQNYGERHFVVIVDFKETSQTIALGQPVPQHCLLIIQKRSGHKSTVAFKDVWESNQRTRAGCFHYFAKSGEADISLCQGRRLWPWHRFFQRRHWLLTLWPWHQARVLLMTLVCSKKISIHCWLDFPLHYTNYDTWLSV